MERREAISQGPEGPGAAGPVLPGPRTSGRAADAIAGALLGAAVGDALGLPRENLSPRRAARLFPGPLGHRLVAGRGLCSDDGEHACLAGQALLASGGEPDALRRALAWRLRGWLLTLPPGVGFATLRSILALWLFVPRRWQGVRSAGNGPCMRAPLLGVVAGDDDARLLAWVRESTTLTHTDPQALEGALAVALGARDGASGDARARLGEPAAWAAALPGRVQALCGSASDPLKRGLELVAAHLDRGAAPAELAAALGCERGVTGWTMHTVPAAMFCWLRAPGDVRAAVEETIRLGGDADSTGSVAGALAGATAGAGAIPPEWLDGLVDWPRSVAWMRRLADRLARRFPAEGPGEPLGPEPVLWPALPVRNLALLAIVLVHALRRALPPY